MPDHWYPNAWSLDNTSCRVLRYLGKDGTWDDSKINAYWPPATEKLPEVIRTRRMTPDLKSTHPALAFAIRISKELANPGKDHEIGLILAAAAGDLERVNTMSSKMLRSGRMPPIHDMAFVAVLGGHVSVLQYCVEQSLQVDDNIAWAAAHDLSSGIFETLWPLNIFGIEQHAEFLEGMLDEVIKRGKYGTEWVENPDAIPLSRFLLKQGAKVTENHITQAAKAQPVEFMKFLLPHANDVDLSECGALHVAVAERRLEMVKLLLDEGCSPNKSHGYCSILVDHNTYDEFGYPLNYAVYRRDVDIIRALIAKGANPMLSCEYAPDAYKYLGDEKSFVVKTIREILDQACHAE